MLLSSAEAFVHVGYFMHLALILPNLWPSRMGCIWQWFVWITISLFLQVSLWIFLDPLEANMKAMLESSLLSTYTNIVDVTFFITLLSSIFKAPSPIFLSLLHVRLSANTLDLRFYNKELTRVFLKQSLDVYLRESLEPATRKIKCPPTWCKGILMILVFTIVIKQ